MRQGQDEHHYTSTACVHQLHDQCRRTCKFCGHYCQCWCHEAGAAVPRCGRPVPLLVGGTRPCVLEEGHLWGHSTSEPVAVGQ